MDFFDVVNSRQSIRTFAPTPVKEEELWAILDAAVNLAPSAGNLQAYRVYVVKVLSRRQALKKAAISASGQEREFFTGAPVVLVFCADTARSSEKYGERGAELFAIQDATIACCYAMLSANALGLGCVWVGSFDPDAVRQVVGAPEGAVPVALMPMGYPAERPERRARRPMDELVHEVEE